MWAPVMEIYEIDETKTMSYYSIGTLRHTCGGREDNVVPQWEEKLNVVVIESTYLLGCLL